MNIVTVEQCPTCGGTGEGKASILLMDDIENNLEYILKEQNERNITLCVHPYIEAFLKKGMVSRQVKWYMRYKKWIRIKVVSRLEERRVGKEWVRTFRIRRWT